MMSKWKSLKYNCMFILNIKTHATSVTCKGQFVTHWSAVICCVSDINGQLLYGKCPSLHLMLRNIGMHFVLKALSISLYGRKPLIILSGLEHIIIICDVRTWQRNDNINDKWLPVDSSQYWHWQYSLLDTVYNHARTFSGNIYCKCGEFLLEFFFFSFFSINLFVETDNYTYLVSQYCYWI